MPAVATAPPPPTSAEIAAQARAELLAIVPGVWGNDGSAMGGASCTTRLTYFVEREGEDDIIVAKGDGDFESRARVTGIEDSSVTTRTVMPVSEEGQIWELRIESDRLHQVDAQGIITPLVRCAS